jgi:metallo-beta-lactamase family protein
MRIRFLGGVREVTGSTHLLMTNHSAVLRDSGLFQGRRAETSQKNLHVYDAVPRLDAVALSHAHIDHCGTLPLLVKHGYDGPIHTTHATADLCALMLRDSAYVQEMDAQYLNKRLARKGEPPIAPLYSLDDAEAVLPLFVGHDYHQPVPLTDDIRVTAYDAGHVLGSALHLFEIAENGRTFRLGYAFDLGRKNLPILCDPEQLTDLDALVIESTYAHRYHRDIRQSEDLLAGVINRVSARGGKVIVPSFALERTQELLHVVQNLRLDQRIPAAFPVVVDSPLAINVTQVFMRHKELFNAETKALLARSAPTNNRQHVRFTRDVEESKALNDDDTPMMIISASGMCESGRILHHLKNNVQDPKNAVVIVGFQAANTLGRRIVERERQLRIFGELYTMNAERIVLNTFSGHADHNELTAFIDNVGERCKTFVLVHGEESALESMAAYVRERRPGCRIEVPGRGDEIELR